MKNPGIVTLTAALVLGFPLTAAAPARAQDGDAGGCVGKARLRGPLFDTSAGALEPGLAEVFDEIARTIREQCAGKDIVIEAHAFEAASPALNRALAEFRALLVEHELASRGIEEQRLLPVAMGSQRPLSKDATPLENRRITFRVLD